MAAEDYHDMIDFYDFDYWNQFNNPTAMEENLKPENIKCPKCDGPMIPRKSRHGVFWGCKKYPECDGTRNSMGEAREDRDEDEDKPERTFSWNRKREI